MLRDKKKFYFSKGKIIGNKRQLTITIPLSDWKFFDVGSRAKIFPKDEYILHIVKPIRAIGTKQRIVTIPFSDRDIFKKGDIVRMYPLVAKSQKKEDKQKKNEQISTKTKVSYLP